MESSARKPGINRRYLLLVVLLALALYVLVPQWRNFHSSLQLLRHPAPAWTLGALLLTFLTYPVGAATYYLLAFKPLRYARTVLVQFGAMFINRLLPGGIGALGANYAYLRRAKHSLTQAASVVAVNNLLGAIGHWLIVAVTLVFFAGSVMLVPAQSQTVAVFLKIAGGVCLLAVVGVLLLGREKFLRKAREVREQLLRYKQRPGRLAAALLSSVALTLSNVLCLLCCAMAVGVHLPFAVILIIFTFGISAGTATPTPGGLGGYEAALAAGFIAYHVASPSALAAALLYRLVSYWLPLLVGAPALVICQRRHVFKA